MVLLGLIAGLGACEIAELTRPMLLTSARKFGTIVWVSRLS